MRHFTEDVGTEIELIFVVKLSQKTHEMSTRENPSDRIQHALVLDVLSRLMLFPCHNCSHTSPHAQNTRSPMYMCVYDSPRFPEASGGLIHSSEEEVEDEEEKEKVDYARRMERTDRLMK